MSARFRMLHRPYSVLCTHNILAIFQSSHRLAINNECGIALLRNPPLPACPLSPVCYDELERKRGGGMAAIIGIVSQKGGVGKSTLARLVAREYANAGWRAKIVDLDYRRELASTGRGAACDPPVSR